MIHEDLINKNSTYFRECRLEQGPIAEVKDVKLSFANASCLRQYLDWLYAGREVLSGIVRRYSRVVPIGKEKWRRALIDLWLLGEDLGDTGFKNQVMDHLQKIQFSLDEKLGLAGIVEIYDKTRPESGLRSWLLDHTVGIRHSTLKGLQGAFPNVAKDMVYALWERNNERVMEYEKGGRDGINASNMDKCKYHEHAPGEKCCESISG